MAVAHFGALAMVAAIGRLPRGGGNSDGSTIWWLRIVRNWYPLAMLPLFYWELAVLNRLIFTVYFDQAIVNAEQWLFRFQPSQELRLLFPWSPLSEILHCSYGFYEIMLPVTGLTFFIRRRDEEFRRFLTTVFFTFLSCYLLFILIPVRGPFHHFGPLDAENGGFCCQLIHRLLGAASSEGTAFPSSHVAASIAIWLALRPSFPRLARVILIVDIGIFVGTVYGGFHYGVDALAGLVVGVVLGLLGPRVYSGLDRWLAGRRKTQRH